MDRRVDYLPLTGIHPASRNPKKHALTELGASFDQFGYVEPMVLDDRTEKLVAGHGRREQLIALSQSGAQPPAGINLSSNGEWLVPVLRGWSSKNDEEAEAFLLTSNKLTELGGWNRDDLAPILADIQNRSEIDLTSIGWAQKEIDEILNQKKARDAVDAGPEAPPLHPVSKLGEVYQLGPHRIMCGDSTNVDHVYTLMDGKRAIMCATDPPYLVDYDGGNHPQSYDRENSGKDNNKQWDQYRDPAASVEFFAKFIRVAFDHALFEQAAFYQWHASKRQMLVEQAWIENKMLLHQQIIWVKSRAILTRSHFMWQHEPCFYGWRKQPEMKPPASGQCTSVWKIDQKGHQDGIHPTQKPLEIFTRPIGYHTKIGDLVYEPFSGSGSQLIAAAQESRVCYALELEPSFVDVARKRWTTWAKSAGIDPGNGALE